MKLKTILIVLVLLLGHTYGALAQSSHERFTKEVWIENNSRSIYGILSRAKDSEVKQPLVIIAHGFNGTHDFGKNYFETLNNLGYQCFTFDFPCGAVNSRSNNNTMEMSVLDQQSDLEAIIRYFKSQPDVDVDNIVLIGESQGGLVASLTAAHVAKDIRRLILVYPALCIPAQWNKRYPQLSEIPDTTRIWNVPLGRRFFTELRDMEVFSIIGKFKKPVLIIQGDADAIVSLEDSRRALKIYKDAHLHIIPGAGHGFKANELKELLLQIEGFLKPGI